MVLIQIELPSDLDIKIRHLLIDEDMLDKRELIIKLLREHFEKCVD